MIINEKQFFEELLDLTIPELKSAADAFAKGNKAEAEHIFAEYVKATLKPECQFKLPYGGKGNSSAAAGESCIEIANRVCENKFISVGVPIDFGVGNKIDWRANPTYNRYKEWEVQFHRHHEWAALAEAYRITGDEKYAENYARIIHSWITEALQYPDDPSPWFNYHWRTIECGIRMTRNWHWAIHAFLKSPKISDSLWTLIFMSVWEHGHRLYHDHTRFNWLTMEMNGLLRIGKLYPFFKEAKTWGDFALEKFVVEAETQFYPDNLQVELTTGYHGVVVTNFLSIIDFLNAYGIEIPDRLYEDIHKMFYMYMQMVEPDMKTPALNDGGRADVPEQYRKGLKYFPNDEYMKYFASGFSEGKCPEFNSLVMEYAGFVVMRTGFNPNDMWAFFESAPFGANHQHEDKLNFLLYAYGADMLPDTGNFRYDTSKMRDYVRTTRSHNTGLVDGLAQNRRKTHKRVTPEDTKVKSDLRAYLGKDFEIAEGVYNQGYGPDLLDATHKRKVIWFKKGHAGSLPFFVIIDSFSAKDGEEHLYESSWQLTEAPITVRANKVSATYQNGAVLNMISSVCPRIFIAQEEPEYMGWRPDHTPESRVHIPAPLVSYAQKATEAITVTLLYPAPNGECPITDVKADGDGFDIFFDEEAVHFDYNDPKFSIN